MSGGTAAVRLQSRFLYNSTWSSHNCGHKHPHKPRCKLQTHPTLY